MRNWMICLGLTGTLASCGLEAGYQVDSGTFGNATLNNTQMMNGERSYAQVLADRFAREVPTQINFAFDSAELDATAQQVLTLQADWIRQFPEVRFRVYGHTDAVGSSGYNKSLGMRRARAVVSFFASRGISRSRLEAVVSYGETQPLVPTSERERRNRRTVTQVSGFVDGHQNLLDGKYAQVVYREYIKSAEPKTTVEIETSSSAFEQ
ncbi:OmpA family protein [Ruegeria pomeroyi]|uniref:OmpA family protein n=1 Tax=Ruegeria alba TaxID=2916756 RepID=A0ABS9NYM3_9RHOB|nr:OmpA family protein [Ruegeria alba]MCE8513233.1 OmpA family protein [Ruegeria pomeroyi]MCE8522450.1 OmpA family protein [Ruegeria pomeroyi]MCE8526838.1 OmpA family protein [Ruegeria pomeroyi]MCE8530118.1 OmpA family protein [Ruegeria pomeroyi]MCE8534774.1 OmpA family protein [Ruegeria pomeroyi]